MRIVDVLAARSFQDGERIITQVPVQPSLLLFSPVWSDRDAVCLQGDEADCFYIVESGQVKIMIKSKVSAVAGIGSLTNVTFSAVTVQTVAAVSTVTAHLRAAGMDSSITFLDTH